MIIRNNKLIDLYLICDEMWTSVRPQAQVTVVIYAKHATICWRPTRGCSEAAADLAHGARMLGCWRTSKADSDEERVADSSMV